MKRKCPICGIWFEPKNDKHVFCVRSCFKFNYNRILRERAKIKPKFACSECGKITMLKFDPKKNKKKWESFVCSCGYKNSFDY